MLPDFRQTRMARLRGAQNADGGWGYFPGKLSRLEPTCYSLLALYGDESSSEAWKRGWNLVQSWQGKDGSTRPAATIAGSSWATSLVVTLHCVNQSYGTQVAAGVSWLLGSKGSEGGLLERGLALIRRMPIDYDRRYKGWPWSTETSSWIEPTSHSILALKKAARKIQVAGLSDRVTEGERMILDRRSPDGGWNYGNSRVLEAPLPSYPETTGVALIGLQGSSLMKDADRALAVAERHRAGTRSRLAKAWLTISLRNYGKNIVLDGPDEPGEDLMIVALEALASPNGGHQWLKPA